MLTGGLVTKLAKYFGMMVAREESNRRRQPFQGCSRPYRRRPRPCVFLVLAQNGKLKRLVCGCLLQGHNKKAPVTRRHPFIAGASLSPSRASLHLSFSWRLAPLLPDGAPCQVVVEGSAQLRIVAGRNHDDRDRR